jgi:hypothetical protein
MQSKWKRDPSASDKDVAKVREAALKAISPIRPAEKSAYASALFRAERTNAGYQLPAYYLVYFLFVDLLGFPDLGSREKTAWCIPIDFKGQFFAIEHRKLGVGVFTPHPASKEKQAQAVVKLIDNGVNAAKPFFEWKAHQAVRQSTLNVNNRSSELFARFKFFFELYRAKITEAVARKDECIIESSEVPGGGSSALYIYPAFELRRHAQWLGLSAVDAFFSWTEHVFIHVAILGGKLKSGMEVADAAESDWQAKFKTALDLRDIKTKALFDRLVVIRRQLKNFLAHGSFGKEGEAFKFHSGAGAVPVLLPHQADQGRFTLYGETILNEASALEVIEEFVAHLWSNERAPAEIYIQQRGLPSILTLASNGIYTQATSSIEEMKSFVEYMEHECDDAANMDW